jgi:hypothetical protein
MLPVLMTICYRSIAIAALLHLLVMAETPGLSAEESAAGDPSGVVDVVLLDESDLDESSGLALSRRRPNHFWSHNDSGAKARLYAFDSRGRKTGQVKLKSAKPVDWEDIACFADQGVSRLLVADCGDNQSERESITLYLFDEPDPTKSTSIEKTQKISVLYPDGPRDCEAVAVDQQRRLIVLVSKSKWPAAGIYVVPLPERVTRSTRTTVTAHRIGTLPLPMITAMDIHQPSGDVWLVSYFHAFRYACSARNGLLARQLTRITEIRELPRWKQIESVAVDAANDIWVTSEGAPAPLGRLPHNNHVSRRPRRP